jgi:transposase
VARGGAVKARTAALNQLKDLITTAPEELRAQLRGQRLLQAAKACARMRPDTSRVYDPVQATKTALQAIGTRVTTLTDEITTADKRLKALLAHAAPRTMTLLESVHRACRPGSCWSPPGRTPPGCGRRPPSPPSAAPALSRPAAANPTATASTGAATGGANRTLHMIAVVRMRWCPATRAYVQRRTAQGMSKKDIIRCLKRYIARATYTAIQQDLANLAKQIPSGT